jgi:uncharacterized membrane protein
MKSIRISATISAILGFLSVIALIFLFLALSDIANHEPDLTLEWYISGICIIIISAFTISTFFTLGFLFKTKTLFKDPIVT